MKVIGNWKALAWFCWVWMGIGLSAAPAQSTDGDALFDVPGIHDVRVYFNQQGYWDSLVAYKPLDKFMMAAVEIDGNYVDSIGIQLKGNSSYNSYPGDKKPIKIAFDEYVGQKYDGLKTINLNNAFKDPTLMREKLMLDFCLRNGIPAPRCTYARVYLNGTYWGLYTLVEQVNKTFLTDRFGDNDGNLFKGDPNGTLQWMGPAASNYYSQYELKTNETANDWADLVELIDVINNTAAANFETELELVLDAQTFIDIWASNILFSNLDSYQGSGHNYYVYHDTTEDRFKFISWDVNEAFGNFQMGMGWPGIQTMTPFFIPSPATNRPLTNNMLQNTSYHDAYVDRLCEFATYDFTTAHLYPIIDSLANVIRADVYADTKKMYTNAQFEDNIVNPINSGPQGQIPGLKDFIIGRRNALQTQLSGFGCTMVVGVEANLAQGVRVWPNPSSGKVMFESDVEMDWIVVMDIAGKVVLEQWIGTNMQEVNLGLPAGIYTYRISMEGSTVVGRLVVTE
jgi:spore coat protein H